MLQEKEPEVTLAATPLQRMVASPETASLTVPLGGKLAPRVRELGGSE